VNTYTIQMSPGCKVANQISAAGLEGSITLEQIASLDKTLSAALQRVLKTLSSGQETTESPIYAVVKEGVFKGAYGPKVYFDLGKGIVLKAGDTLIPLAQSGNHDGWSYELNFTTEKWGPYDNTTVLNAFLVNEAGVEISADFPVGWRTLEQGEKLPSTVKLNAMLKAGKGLGDWVIEVPQGGGLTVSYKQLEPGVYALTGYKVYEKADKIIAIWDIKAPEGLTYRETMKKDEEPSEPLPIPDGLKVFASAEDATTLYRDRPVISENSPASLIISEVKKVKTGYRVTRSIRWPADAFPVEVISEEDLSGLF
jgi:hypothetical protein